MKKLLFAGFLALSFVACKNQSGMTSTDVPAEVVASFNQRYPMAEKVNWDMSDGLYEAEFKTNGEKQEVYYRSDGSLVEVENITAADVPTEVMTSFNQRYPTAEKVDWDSDNGLYEAEFKINGNKQEVYYKPDGTLVQVKNKKIDMSM